MNNRKSIEKILQKLGIIYSTEQMIKNDVTIDMYFISFIADNFIMKGGILDGGASDDRHISILFFFESSLLGCQEDEVLSKVNNYNLSCKYGNFTYDGTDINYRLSIPAINNDLVSENVIEFYLKRVISVLKEVAEELADEG